MSETIYYAIGDVHGEIEKLDRLMELMRDDARRLGALYKFVFLSRALFTNTRTQPRSARANAGRP